MGGAIDTNTLLLIGAGVAAVYFLTKPKVTTPVVTYPPGYAPTSTSNPTSTIANDATSVLNNILSIFG